MRENLLIVGATSGIAQALCRILAARGCQLVLAARNTDELGKLAADLRIRYQAQIAAEPFDALEIDGHERFFARCLGRLDGRIDGIVLCYGDQGDQIRSQTDYADSRRTIDINLTSAVCLLSIAANYLEQRRSGYIAAISSVAGDRGRQSNYTYGAAKAGLTAYLQGLRNRLYHARVHVLTVKPGFVDTPMTRGRINPASPLLASPDKVALAIDRGIRGRRNVIYTPWFWRVIMQGITLVPESLFKRLRL